MLGDGNVKRTFAIYNAKPEWIEKLPSVKSIRLSRENIGACTSLSSMRASFRTGSSKSCYHHVHTGVRGMALLIKNYRPSNSRPVSFNSTEASRTIHQLYPFSFPPSLSLSLSLSLSFPAALFKLSLCFLLLSFSRTPLFRAFIRLSFPPVLHSRASPSAISRKNSCTANQQATPVTVLLSSVCFPRSIQAGRDISWYLIRSWTRARADLLSLWRERDTYSEYESRGDEKEDGTGNRW